MNEMLDRHIAATIFVLLGTVVLWARFSLRLRTARREAARIRQDLTRRLQQHQQELQSAQSTNEQFADTIGTVLIVATSHSANLVVDGERQQALTSIEEFCRAAVRTCRDQATIAHPIISKHVVSTGNDESWSV